MKLITIYESLFDKIEKNRDLKNNPITLKLFKYIDEISQDEFDEYYDNAKSWNPDFNDDMIFRSAVGSALETILANGDFRKMTIKLDSELGAILMAKFEEKFG